MLTRIRTLAIIGLLGAGLGPGGCTSASDLFNQAFLGDLGAGSRVASIPGDAPALLVSVENRVDKPVRMTLSYRTTATGVQMTTYEIQSAEHSAQALVCPIDDITLGDVSDLKAVGAVVVLSTSSETDAIAPIIEVEPFGALLKSGVNYNCGDAITFTVERSSETRSGYRIFAYIEHAGG